MWEIWQDFCNCEIKGKSNRVKLSIAVYTVLFCIISKQKSKLKFLLFSITTHWNSNCKEGTQMEKQCQEGWHDHGSIHPSLIPVHQLICQTRLQYLLSSHAFLRYWAPYLSVAFIYEAPSQTPLPDIIHRYLLRGHKKTEDGKWELKRHWSMPVWVGLMHLWFWKRFVIRCSEEAENIKCTIINVIHIFMAAVRWSLNHFPTFAYS